MPVTGPHHNNSNHSPANNHHRVLWISAVLTSVAVIIVAGIGYWSGALNPMRSDSASPEPSPTSSRYTAPTSHAIERIRVPAPLDTSAQGKARRAVAAMGLDEQIGQLVMTPLYAGTDPSTLQRGITAEHIGSVLIIGNWMSGISGVKHATDTLQSYAPANNKLIVATDQEGGQVQHLKGPGFSKMPPATQQGQWSPASLQRAAQTWGAQLRQAGINLNLAPVVGTVQGPRSANAPIGALNRDFGGDSASNADHAKAFIEGLRASGVQASIKHYPGLGAVQGNTDFTANGVTDTTTTFDGEEIEAFNAALSAKPAMVMMSLATYTQLDSSQPAAFSSTIIDQHLRQQTGFQGVVTSDSLSAAALGSTDPGELGVRFINAGGDLACIGAADYVEPIIQGLKRHAQSDSTLVEKITRSATRVMTLKYQMGVAA